MGTVRFQIVPCSSSYFFSRSVGPSQCLVNANYRVLIWCTCHFQSGSLFFVYFGFLCLQVCSLSNFSLTQGSEGGHLFRLTCSVVLWGGRNQSEVTQSCPTFCDPMDCSLPGSSVHEILQERILEWVAISFFRGSS